MLSRIPKRYPALFIAGLVAVAAAIVEGAIPVSPAVKVVALVVLAFAGGIGIHTQVSPAKARRGRLR